MPKHTLLKKSVELLKVYGTIVHKISADKLGYEEVSRRGILRDSLLDQKDLDNFYR